MQTERWSCAVSNEEFEEEGFSVDTPPRWGRHSNHMVSREATISAMRIQYRPESHTVPAIPQQSVATSPALGFLVRSIDTRRHGDFSG
jgi:hypothetical protein